MVTDGEPPKLTAVAGPASDGPDPCAAIVTRPIFRGAPALPASVTIAIRQRLARLPAELVELLRAAAIIGREFDAALLAAVAGLSIEQTEEWLRAACNAKLVRAEPSGLFAFGHDMIRESL